LLTRGLGDRGDPGQRGDRVGMGERLAGVAPLGQDLCGVNRSGPGKDWKSAPSGWASIFSAMDWSGLLIAVLTPVKTLTWARTASRMP
jgi:hypothetical protein